MVHVSEGLSNQITKLMRIEAWGWNSNSSRPVIIVVALVVSELPELVLGKASVITNNEKFGSRNGTTSNILSDQEKFKMIRYNSLWNNCTGTGVDFTINEESVIDSLVDRDLSEFGVVVLTELLEAFLNLGDFDLHDELDLRLTHTVSVEDDKLRQLTVLFLILLQSFFHQRTNWMNDFLSHLLLDIRDWTVLGEVPVHGGTETDNGFPVLSGVMEDISTDQHGVFG